MACVQQGVDWRDIRHRRTGARGFVDVDTDGSKVLGGQGDVGVVFELLTQRQNRVVKRVVFHSHRFNRSRRVRRRV